jgi:hypothetical protein
LVIRQWRPWQTKLGKGRLHHPKSGASRERLAIAQILMPEPHIDPYRA